MMATAGPALVFEAAEQGNVVMAQLVGVINEDNSLDERLTATRGKGVLIDLANVERINSCGVRDWIRFAQRLEAAGNALYLLRCSPVVVAQLNMVRNFCGERGQVLSFQAPYFCANCDEERTETFAADKVSQGASPNATCPTCKGPMEFDDLPDLYFAFARIHGARAVPAEIQGAMDAFREGRLPPGPRLAGGTPVPPTPRPGGSGTVPSVAKPAAAPAVAQPSTPVATAAPPPAPRSNPALAARPAAAASGVRPSNPALNPPQPAASAQAGTAASIRRPSQPGLPSVGAPGAAAPAQPAAGAQSRPSGPKPAARPLMGGSPFPSRPSGPKVAVGGSPPTVPGVDPTKK